MPRSFIFVNILMTALLTVSCSKLELSSSLGFTQNKSDKSKDNSKYYKLKTASISHAKSNASRKPAGKMGTTKKARNKYNYRIGPFLNKFTALNTINAYRKNKGLKPVKMNSKLVLAARQHSTDMAKKDRISHTGSDGSDPWDRVVLNGYRPEMTAENIGTGHMKFHKLFAEWKDSKLHDQNLLLADAEEIGLALVYDPKTKKKTFWTLILAAKE